MRFLVVLGLVGLLSMPLAWSPVAASESRSAHTRAQLHALQQRIEKVRHEIAADSHRRGKLSDDLDAARKRISAARRRLRTLDDSIKEHRRRIARLERKRDAQRDELGDQLSELRRQVRAAYMHGDINRMRLLLSNQSPERLGRMLTYYRYFTDAQTAQVKQLKTILEKLARQQQALSSEKAELAERRETRKKTLDKLEAGQKRQQAAIAALDKKLSAHKDSLGDMRASEAHLKHLLNSVQKSLSDLPAVSPNTPFAQLKGRMTPPVKGSVIARFGQRKAGGPLRWKGEWLAAKAGTPVRAVAAGRVVYVGYMKRYGLIVILDHGQGYYTLYGHAESTYVDVGDTVHGGQPVVAAGHSGGHARSGTFFEIRKGSRAVDPAAWLSG